VCLVLKDHSGDLFYKEHHARAKIEATRNDPAAPQLVHLDAFLSEGELAALYRACDVAAFPYRAEGFCIPILEAMACGTPAIVPDFGACLDFCDASTSYLVKPRRIRAPVSRSFKVALGFEEEVSEIDFCEIPADRLAEALRAAYTEAAQNRSAHAEAGVARAHGSFTWAHANGIVLDRISKLVSS
jgi:glycosyltransferase involved in cell wall biosynthesis